MEALSRARKDTINYAGHSYESKGCCFQPSLEFFHVGCETVNSSGKGSWKHKRRKLHSGEESKSKCGRKGKASGTSRKHTKNPEPETEPEPGPDPGPPQEVKEDVKDKPVHPDPENERPALLVESAKLSITEETATTSTDDAGETKSPGIEIPETLQLQAEDVPRENAPFEEQMFLYF
uniref:uncharacterized protein hemgn isoform X1 n=1 Tax=Pristiophorus japonicus TaxID=55135 RepID=UPI00398F070A